MAIYSLHHSHVGKATQKQAGTAGAHVHYITRAGAARLVMGEHMPTDRHQARAWVDEREATDRKNGRVIDKLMVALPLELDGQQRADLVREFVAEIGGGRVSWLAAVHDRGEDALNPHVHILLRDKDHETGKRVFGTSEKGSTDRLREIWETVANRVLEREGQEARIDRRSLVDQGLAREAGIHVGPNVLAMEERGLRPVSIAQDHTTSRGNERVVDWPTIDEGRTRADRQREIEAMNRQAEAERGKEKGRQEAELVPAAEISPAHEAEQLRQVEPVQQPEAKRDQVAAILRGLDDQAMDITSLIATPQLEREAEARERVSEGMDVAGQGREATQRASHEVAIPEPAREPIEIRLERSRLVRIIEAGRERLASMAGRLEQAFQAFRERQQIRVEIQPERLPREPEQEKAAAAERDPWAHLIEIGRKAREAEAAKQTQPEKQQEREDLGRSLWTDYSRGRERKGPGF